MLGHAAAPQTPQKRKWALLVIRLLMKLELVRAAVKVKPVIRQQKPATAQQDLALSHTGLHHISLHLHFFFSLPFCISIPFPFVLPSEHLGNCFSARSKGGRRCQHSHVAQVRVLGKGARLDVS